MKYRLDSPGQLFIDILGKIKAFFHPHQVFVVIYNVLQLGRGYLVIEDQAQFALVFFNDIVKQVVLHIQDNIAEHLYKTPVAIVCKAHIPG